MFRLLVLLLLLPTAAIAAECPQTLDFRKRALADDRVVDLCREYAGKVILLVNTASKCAYTPQYDGLEALYRRYKDQGLVVLGFPSNDFGSQEPGTEQQIQSFCRLTYGVEFPMFEKTRVRQGMADPLYQTLGDIAGEYPRWNFHKYLLNRDGELVGSYRSSVKPDDGKLLGAIEALL